MRAIWKTILSTGTSDPAILVDGIAVPVRIHRSPRARTYRLSIDSARGELRLSLPVGASVNRALGWAQDHAPWIREQMAARPVGAIWLADGVTLPFQGRDVRICHDPDASRRVVLDGDRLIVGGAAESVGARVLRWLKGQARTILEAQTYALARAHGLTVASVGIGDPRSRWGSCAASGAIRYSWRLILCPPDVWQSTVAHEVAHLLHMDHSPAFHAAHARLLERDPRPARIWLREHGIGLHRFVA